MKNIKHRKLTSFALQGFLLDKVGINNSGADI